MLLGRKLKLTDEYFENVPKYFFYVLASISKYIVGNKEILN